MASRTEKPLSEVIEQRRATSSFDGAPIPDADLKKILEAGLNMPSGYNLQIRRGPHPGRAPPPARRQL